MLVKVIRLPVGEMPGKFAVRGILRAAKGQVNIYRRPKGSVGKCDLSNHVIAAIHFGRSAMSSGIIFPVFWTNSFQFPSTSPFSRLTKSETPRIINTGVLLRFATQAMAPDSQSTAFGRYRCSM